MNFNTLMCVSIVTAGIQLCAMDRKQDIKIIPEFFVGRDSIARVMGEEYYNQNQPEYARLWKELSLIKDPNMPMMPWRDAPDNVERLRWLLENRKNELSQQNAQ